MNEKFINTQLLIDAVRRELGEMCKKEGVKVEVKLFTVSSVSKAGVKGIEEYIDSLKVRKIQLLGVPNSGKTTLLNSLTRLNKPVSRIPGTTPHIT